MKRLAILVGVMILTALTAHAADNGNPTLSVIGEGTATVPADMVTISVAVTSNNENLTQAASEVLEKMNKTIEAVKRVGVNQEDLIPGQASGITSIQSHSRVCKIVNNTTICENTTYGLSALDKSTIIQLKTTDRSKIDSVLNAAKSTGASAELIGYGLNDYRSAVADVHKRAVANAKRNAEDLSAAAEGRLGGVIDIAEYAPPYISPSDQPGMVDVTAVVTATYEIVY